VLSHTFGEKDPLGDHVFAQFIFLREIKIDCRKLNLTQ
jgi:hypothetical protein